MKIGKERRNFHTYFMFSYMSSSQILGGIDGGDLKKKIVIGRSRLSSNQSHLSWGAETVHVEQGAWGLYRV